MSDRRGTYFAFQGLFMAALLLLFLYQSHNTEGWVGQFTLLILLVGTSLAFVRFSTEETLASWWFQAGVFVGDSILATLTLGWGGPQSGTYLIYLLVILGTALTRKLSQSFLVGIVSSALYLFSNWNPSQPLPGDSEFWLRMIFLLVLTALLAIFSQDTHRIEKEREHRFREKLVQFERLATLGQVAGEVAHSIKGPLTTIMVNSEVISHRYAKSKELVREIDQIKHEAERCKKILKNLLDLGRIEEIDFTRLDLREPLRSAVEAVKGQIETYGISIETQGMENAVYVKGDASLLHEAISSILQNAIDALQLQKRVRKDPKKIKVMLKPLDPDGWDILGLLKKFHIVSIQDNGCGIDPKNFDKIFQPFFTTKGQEGSGIGLSAALRILQKHGGSMDVENVEPGPGTRFILLIPPIP